MLLDWQLYGSFLSLIFLLKHTDFRKVSVFAATEASRFLTKNYTVEKY
jgi:hypothetical protein